MKLSSRIARRVGVALIALAAIAAPAAALAAPGSAARPAAAAAVRWCNPPQLMIWLGIPGGATAGSLYYPLEFSNLSHHTCTLRGFPRVLAIGSNGKQLGNPAAHVYTGPVPLVTLRPGQSAHAVLQIAVAGVYPAPVGESATAIALKVYAANDARARYIMFSFPACAKRGPEYMHIRATVPGIGVPMFLY
jgi:hypothetical protein